ncbi:hypothetical protein SETIT_9G511400v2 [Setaria italica]|uniref:Uncharacterized protein n=1 Tax=Setaria italica TaxID=4555 RepID=A0A368SUR0_SETIT|nr:hypothetical protein SETIT_9G511400v2 [Setaria italica]
MKTPVETGSYLAHVPIACPIPTARREPHARLTGQVHPRASDADGDGYSSRRFLSSTHLLLLREEAVWNWKWNGPNGSPHRTRLCSRLAAGHGGHTVSHELPAGHIFSSFRAFFFLFVFFLFRCVCRIKGGRRRRRSRIPNPTGGRRAIKGSPVLLLTAPALRAWPALIPRAACPCLPSFCVSSASAGIVSLLRTCVVTDRRIGVREWPERRY